MRRGVVRAGRCWLHSMKMEGMGLAQAGFLTFVFQCCGFVLAFLWSVLLARGLGPSGRGAYAVMMFVVGTAAMIGNFGISSANAYYSASRPADSKYLFINSMVVAGSIGLVMIGILQLLFFVPAFRAYCRVNMISVLAFQLLSFSVILNLIYVYLNGILLGKNRILEYNIPNISFHGSLTIFVLVLVFGLRLALLGAVISYVLATALTAILVVYSTLRLSQNSLRPNILLLKEAVMYGIKLHLGNIAKFLVLRLDIILVSYFLKPEMVGNYAVAVNIAERLWMIPSLVGTLLLPRMANPNLDSSPAFVLEVARHTIFLTIGIAVVLAVVSDSFVKLVFGEAFEKAVIALLLLLPGAIAMGLFNILSGALSGKGKPHIPSLAALAMLAVVVLLDLLLIPRWNIAGAALASSLSYAFGAGILLKVFVADTKSSYKDFFALRRSDIELYIRLISRQIINGGHKSSE